MNIAIIYGGRSSEHDISVITACLSKRLFDGKIYGIYFDKQNRCFLAPDDLPPKRHSSYKFKNKVSFLLGERAIKVSRGCFSKVIPLDVAVNCCHGVCGEDGSVAALCNYADIPLVGSDVVPSAVAMDKIVTKQVLAGCGFPVLEGFGIAKWDSVDDVTFPVVVKPSQLGSSIGVSVANNSEELSAALSVAFTYSDKVLVERALTDFSEYNCSAFLSCGKVHCSVVAKPITSHQILTFSDKYVGGCKVEVETQDGQTAADVQTLTEQIYTKIGFSGVIRVDYLLDNQSGKLYVNEINSVPGSLGYNLWSASLPPRQFGKLLIEQAIAEKANRRKLITDYVSDVLNLGGAKKP